MANIQLPLVPLDSTAPEALSPSHIAETLPRALELLKVYAALRRMSEGVKKNVIRNWRRKPYMLAGSLSSAEMWKLKTCVMSLN